MDNYSAGTSWVECEKENYCNKSRKAELETLVTFLSKFDDKVAAIWDEGHPVKGRVWEDESSGQGRGEPELGQLQYNSKMAFPSLMTSGIGNDLLLGNTTLMSLPVGTHDLDIIADEELSGMEPSGPEEEDLLISPRTHFKPIRDYRDELPSAPPLAFLPLPQKDPADYAVYNRTASSSFPLLFELKSPDIHDKAIQTDEEDILFSSFTNNNGNSSGCFVGPPPSLTLSNASFSSGSSIEESMMSSGSGNNTTNTIPAFHLSIATTNSSTVSSPSPFSSASSPFYFSASGCSSGYNSFLPSAGTSATTSGTYFSRHP